MTYQMTFKRCELKYLLNRTEKEQILLTMEPHMKRDHYGRTVIRNIYFDTDTFRLTRRSLEKPVYKEKLRIRSYKPVSYTHLVGRYCITAVHRLYSCISGVSDWHAGDHRICGKRFCSRADYGLRVCCSADCFDSEKRKDISGRISSARVKGCLLYTSRCV